MTEQQTILVVDDELHVREFLQKALKTGVYSVVTATNGKEGLEKVTQFNISLMLLDIKMPGLDGLEILDYMRRYAEHIPVIMLSGIDEVSIKAGSLTLGADDYITKPVSVEELLSRIQIKLRRAEPHSHP